MQHLQKLGAPPSDQKVFTLYQLSPSRRRGELPAAAPVVIYAEEGVVNPRQLVLALIDEAYEKKTWHGPNLKQSMKGLTAKQAAWRPGPGRHNIWELTVHAAYWKYAVRRRIAGEKRGSFILKGSNFFARPEKGKLNEAAWTADKKLLEKEHRAMRAAIASVLRTRQSPKQLYQLYGVAFHDVYHAGQIRLLRRMGER